jgi:hypothetical protein
MIKTARYVNVLCTSVRLSMPSQQFANANVKALEDGSLMALTRMHVSTVPITIETVIKTTIDAVNWVEEAAC